MRAITRGLVRELMHLRASQINGCSVCVDGHRQIAKSGGETDERLFIIVAWRHAPCFSDAERAALALTDAVTWIAGRADPVPDELWTEAARPDRPIVIHLPDSPLPRAYPSYP